MPREQIQRLSKRPTTEVEAGQFGTGRTGVVNMPFVHQDTGSGQQLAKALGMAVETAGKVYQMDKATRKEKSRLRVQNEKLDWIKTLDGLPTANEKASWIESKISEVSDPGVDEHYRNAAIGALTPFYSKYLPLATAEYNTGLQGKATNVVVGMLEEGNFSIENLNVTPSFSKMDNKYKHAAITNGITAHYENQIANATTIDEVKALQKDLNRTLATYNSSTFYGGSAAKSALDLKTKMTKAVNTAISSKTSALGTTVKDEINLLKEKNETYETVASKIDAHPTWTKDKKELEKLKYKVIADKYTSLETFKRKFKILSPSNNVNYNSLSEDEKKYVKDSVNLNLDFAINGGMYTSFAETAITNEDIGQAYVKDIFNIKTTDAEIAAKNLTIYKNLKDVEHGQKTLSYLDADTRAFYEMLSANPRMDAEMLRQHIVDSKEMNIRWKEPNESKQKGLSNQKKWQELVLGNIPFEKQNTARRMLTIYSNIMDPDDAIEKVAEDFVNLDTQEATGGMKFNGFSGMNVNYIEENLTNYIFKDTNIDTDNLRVDMDKGVMTVYDTQNPFIPAIQMPYSDFVGAIAVLKAQEFEAQQEPDAERPGGVTNAEVKAFTNSMANPHYDDFNESILGKYGPKISIKEGSWLDRMIKNISKVQEDPNAGKDMTTVGAGITFDLGKSSQNRKAFVNSNEGAFSSKTERAAFMAQVYQESKGKPVTENLNYSASAISSSFGKHRLQGYTASQLARNPQLLANTVYGGAWGKKNLGNTQPGDGWKYRGRGLIQITGRANYEKYGKMLGIDLINNPELALDPKTAYNIAELFWKTNIQSKVKDFTNTKQITKIINGGTHGLTDRQKYFNIYNK